MTTGRLLVTGASGFIGSAVAARALRAGWDVTGVARPGRGVPQGCTAVEADLTTYELDELIASFDPTLVVHAAGAASVARSVADPLGDHSASIGPWIRLLDSVRRSRHSPVVIHLGSAAVYGEPVQLPVHEDDPCRPLSPYGFHKLAAEVLADEYTRCFGLRVVCTRLFSVIGPGQHRLLTWELARQALGPETEIVVRGTGKEARDFVHVGDLADACLAFADTPATGSSDALRVNVATGVETTIAELAMLISRMAGGGKPVHYLGQVSSADPERWVASIERLRRAVPGWSPRSLEQTVEECLDSWRGLTRRGA